MNLEAIEQTCLNYLKQVSNPLVPLSRLLRHLHEHQEFEHVHEDELLDFLRRHDLFEVLDPPGLGASAEGRQMLEEAGLGMEQCVVLETRLPSRDQLREHMDEQIAQLIAALETARDEASNRAESDRVAAINEVLQRAQTLRDQVRQF